MAIPVGMRFLKTHEWARADGEVVTVGVSEYAVEQLNRELVYLELPKVGRKAKQGEAIGVVDAVKAASDLYSPVSGEIVEVNTAAAENPAVTANDPWGEGWLVRIRINNTAEMQTLMSAEDYQKFTESGEAH